MEVNFRKGSKIGTMLSKLKKSRNLDTSVVNPMNFIPLFPQLRFECLIVSTLRSLDVPFLKNFRGLNKNGDQSFKQRAFLLFHGFLGVFEAFFAQRSCLLEILG